MNKVMYFITLAMLMVINVKAEDLTLWYKQEANKWMFEANPIGNGFLGAMFFGKVEEERIQFNEESLWSGGKGEWDDYNMGNVPGAHKHLAEIRQLIDEGKFGPAHSLAKKHLTGKIEGISRKGGNYFKGYGAYQDFGNIYVKVGQSQNAKNYRRSLNISKGLGAVTYEAEGVKHQRTYFASYPKRALVFKFQNDAAKGVDYSFRFDSAQTVESTNFTDNTLSVKGFVTFNKMEFEARFLIKTDGAVEFKDSQVQVKGAKEAHDLCTQVLQRIM